MSTRQKCILLLIFLLILGLNINYTCFAADWIKAGDTELTLENEPKIEGIAIIKIKATVYTDIPNEAITKARVYCGIPEGLQFINDKNYIVERKYSVSDEWFDSVTLYEGPMKKNETKEILFKVKVPDTKKYTIFGGVTGSGDRELEIDLGEPQPPDWKAKGTERAGIKDGKHHILVRGIKQLDAGKLVDLTIPEDSLPPLRSELRIRTKDKPYINMPYNPKEIPLRYLVYVQEKTKDVEVTLELPEGLELINDQNYEITRKENLTLVKLFRGPMRFKECKAFYFKVRSDKKECFRVKAQTKVLTVDAKELMVEDYQDIELGRILF